MAAGDDDWRLQGQERYLSGAALRLEQYVPPRPDWDHDHCEFCSQKISAATLPDAIPEGFTTEDRRHWVCPTCFSDFRDRFAWTLR